jgi:TetR/AcrR family transcriptional regulator
MAFCSLPFGRLLIVTRQAGVMDVKSKILIEAVRLFGEKGYEGTSLQSIADAVGVRKQSLFHHFKSKAELRQAVLTDLFVHWQQKPPNLLADASSGYKRFTATMEALVKFLIEDTGRAQFALREMLDRPVESRKLLAEELHPWTTMLTNYIQMGKDTGVIRPDVNPEAYPILIMMMATSAVAIGSVASAMTDTETESSIEPRIKELVRIAGNSLFNEPKTDK